MTHQGNHTLASKYPRVSDPGEIDSPGPCRPWGYSFTRVSDPREIYSLGYKSLRTFFTPLLNLKFQYLSKFLTKIVNILTAWSVEHQVVWFMRDKNQEVENLVGLSLLYFSYLQQAIPWRCSGLLAEPFGSALTTKDCGCSSSWPDWKAFHGLLRVKQRTL